MSQRDDDSNDKTLLSEQLPAPAPLVNATPRQRTGEHLRRILAAAGIALNASGAAHADASLPPPKKPGDDKGDKKQVTAVPKKKKPKPHAPPVDPGYYVVDMLPEPAEIPPPVPPKPVQVQPREFGWLSLTSNVAGTIRVDGKDTGLRTPQPRMELEPGVHAITLVDDRGMPIESFTVTIAPNKETVERRDPKPAPAKKP